MRRLTDEERIALVEVGPPGEGPLSDATFAELVRLGWGCWRMRPGLWNRLLGRRYWHVTPAGVRARELDSLARSPSWEGPHGP